MVKNAPANSGDKGSIPGPRSPRERNGNPLQYSCLKNPMNRRTWWAIVHGVPESQAQLRDLAKTRDEVSCSQHIKA